MDPKNQIKFVDADGSVEVIPMTSRVHRPSLDHPIELNSIQEELASITEDVNTVDTIETEVVNTVDTVEAEVVNTIDTVEAEVVNTIENAVDHNVKSLENMEKNIQEISKESLEVVSNAVLSFGKTEVQIKPKGCCIVQ